MSKKTYLILDGNNLAYRANYTMNMSFGGKPAGVVFGLMNMIEVTSGSTGHIKLLYVGMGVVILRD
jgi:5'-3' exonuclease